MGVRFGVTRCGKGGPRNLLQVALPHAWQACPRPNADRISLACGKCGLPGLCSDIPSGMGQPRLPDPLVLVYLTLSSEIPRAPATPWP